MITQHAELSTSNEGKSVSLSKGFTIVVHYKTQHDLNADSIMRWFKEHILPRNMGMSIVHVYEGKPGQERWAKDKVEMEEAL